MIVNVIHVKRVAFFEAEDNTPAARNLHCPETSQIALQRTEVRPWEVHISDLTGSVEQIKDIG